MRELSRPTDWQALQLFLEIPSVNQYTVNSIVSSHNIIGLTLSLFSSAILFDQIKKENRNKLRLIFIYSFYVILTFITHVGKILTSRPNTAL